MASYTRGILSLVLLSLLCQAHAQYNSVQVSILSLVLLSLLCQAHAQYNSVQMSILNLVLLSLLCQAHAHYNPVQLSARSLVLLRLLCQAHAHYNSVQVRYCNYSLLFTAGELSQLQLTSEHNSAQVRCVFGSDNCEHFCAAECPAEQLLPLYLRLTL